MRSPEVVAAAAAGARRRGRSTHGALAAALALAVAGGEALAQGGSGSVAGTVRLTEPAPEIRPIVLEAEHHCAKIAGRRLPQEEVVTGPGGGLANVFVRLEGTGLAAAAGPAAAKTVLIEQRGCIFLPRMVGARAGQTLRVVNLDDAYHNVRSVSEAGDDFNISQPFSGMEFDFRLAAEQKMLRLRCDAHPWMRAFVGVVGHPWFAVTAEDGRFELAGVPPGSYEVELWHERFGTLRGPVSVAAGAVATADFAFEVGGGARP